MFCILSKRLCIIFVIWFIRIFFKGTITQTVNSFHLAYVFTHTVLCVTNCCSTLIEQSFLFPFRRSFMTVSVYSPVCTRTVLAVILVGWIGPMSVLKLVLSNSLQCTRCICSADYVLRESAKITWSIIWHLPSSRLIQVNDKCLYGCWSVLWCVLIPCYCICRKETIWWRFGWTG